MALSGKKRRETKRRVSGSDRVHPARSAATSRAGEKETYFDNSILSSLACTTRAYLRHVLYLTSPDGQATLESGSAGHEVLASFCRGEPIERALLHLKAYKKWAEEQIESGIQIQPRLLPENLRKVLTAWMKDHPVTALPFTIKQVEIGFQQVLSEPERLVLTGRMDLLVQDQTGAVVPADHKMTGRIAPSWVDKFRIDSQLSGYMWAAKKHTGKLTTKAYINAIQLGVLPGSNRMCPLHKREYAECGSLHSEAKIFLVNRTPEMIQRWRRDAIILGRRFKELKALGKEKGESVIKDLPMEGAFFNACMYCEFASFCAHGRPVESLKDLFVKDKWDPLSYSLGRPRR